MYIKLTCHGLLCINGDRALWFRLFADDDLNDLKCFFPVSTMLHCRPLLMYCWMNQLMAGGDPSTLQLSTDRL